MKSFGLTRENAQDKDVWRLRIWGGGYWLTKIYHVLHIIALNCNVHMHQFCSLMRVLS